jgi:transcriptional regulator with XRE-family HTH domain
MDNMSRRDPVFVAVGLNVGMRREAFDSTREALVEKAGLDRTDISDIERGPHTLSVSSVVKIARDQSTPASERWRYLHRTKQI